MTSKQKIELRLSETRSRLNEIAGLEGADFTDSVRAESEALTAEYGQLEVRHRAAIVAEGADQAAAEVGQHADGTADGDKAEVRQLLREVNLTDFLTAAAGGGEVRGKARELCDALEVPPVGPGGGVAVPWRVLLPEGGLAPEPERRERDEQRAFTTTTNYAGGVQQRPILQRLFGVDILDALGVRIDTVPAGRTEWPLLSGGVAPAQKAEGTAADAAVAAKFVTEVLKPKRLTGVYEFTHEQAAQVPDLEQALRRDLADAVRAKMSDLVLNGDEATNAEEPDGFLTTISAPTDPSAVATFETYAGVHAQAVDGIHASREGEVSSVVGVASYKHAASVYQSGSGESGSEALSRRSRSCMAASFVPAAVSNVQSGNVLHAGGPNGGAMRGDSVAAVWPTLEVIRDIYSKASQGVVLTWITLWDAQTAFRSGAYARVAFQLA